MTDTTHDSDLVPVYVPRYLLTTVYAFIAERNQDRRDSGGIDASIGEAGVPGHLMTTTAPAQAATPTISAWLWSVDDFRMLRRDGRPSTAQIVMILDALAAEPDRWVPAAELCAATGLSPLKLRGTFAGFTRVCRTLRSDGQREWPLMSGLGPPVRKGHGRAMRYSMPVALAGRWIESAAAETL